MKKTVADPVAVQQLIDRLLALRPAMQPTWGTLTAPEMLCHLGDGTSSVRNPTAARAVTPSSLRTRIMKWFALRSPLAWPHGLQTPATVDPKQGGTRPGDFEADRQRAIEGIRAMAAASAESLLPSHGAFGPMTLDDWHRWAYRHTDHHLRQFDL